MSLKDQEVFVRKMWVCFSLSLCVLAAGVCVLLSAAYGVINSDLEYLGVVLTTVGGYFTPATVFVLFRGRIVLREQMELEAMGRVHAPLIRRGLSEQQQEEELRRRVELSNYTLPSLT